MQWTCQCYLPPCESFFWIFNYWMHSSNLKSDLFIQPTSCSDQVFFSPTIIFVFFLFSSSHFLCFILFFCVPSLLCPSFSFSITPSLSESPSIYLDMWDAPLMKCWQVLRLQSNCYDFKTDFWKALWCLRTLNLWSFTHRLEYCSCCVL